MDIRCPSCKTLYEFNEGRLKHGPVNLKCSQCSHVFRVEGKKGAEQPPPRRWMLRKASGDVLYFQGLTTLQKWIVDQKVSRDDSISKTGQSWKKLGGIGELSSFFQVADSLAPMTRPPETEAPEPDPVDVDFFDPLAPGLLGEASSPGDDWAITSASASSSEWLAEKSGDVPSQSSPSIDKVRAPEPFRDSPLSFDMASELAPPKPLELSRTADLYDDPEPRREGSMAPTIVIVLLLLIFGLVGYAYMEQPQWLGIERLDDPDPSPVSALGDLPAPRAADAGDAADALAAADGDAAGALAALDAAAPAAADAALAALPSTPDAPPDKVEDKAEDKNDPVKDPARDKPVADRPEATGGGFDSAMKRAEQHLNAGRSTDALREFSKAADERPTNISALYGKGRAYLAMGRPDAAISIFSQALRMSPGNGLALMGLADAYRKSGQNQQAIESYRKFLAMYPSGPSAERAQRNIEMMSGGAPRTPTDQDAPEDDAPDDAPPPKDPGDEQPEAP